ncbi:MAG: type I-A CRISPR-associated protein Csa5 [Nitrososphaeria archaeon]
MLEVDELARVLAILIAEQNNYTYVDKLGNAPSKELAIFHIREALRDFNSLLAKENFSNKKAKEEVSKVYFKGLDEQINELSKISDRRKLKEMVSLIGAKALTMAARLKVAEKGEEVRS